MNGAPAVWEDFMYVPLAGVRGRSAVQWDSISIVFVSPVA